jgi:cell division protein FtsB
MFCNKCGAPAEEGSRFCDKCGNQLPMATPAEQAPEKQAARDRAGFFSSPAGIALVVILGIVVLGGLATGIFFLVKDDSGNKADAATMDVWSEYEEALEDDGSTLAKISMTNTDSLFAAQGDLEEAQERVEALQRTLARTAGTEARRRSGEQPPGASRRDMLAGELEEALKAYEAYLSKVAEFVDTLIWTIANNQLVVPDAVNKLNAILADMQKLADNVKDTAEAFIGDNELLTGTEFDPAVLAFAQDIAPEVEAKVAEIQASEAARLEAEKQAAEAEAARLEAEKRRLEEEARQAQYVTCPLCGGVGTIEGGDGRYVCPFCGGSGSVTRSKADTYDPMDWVP